MLRIGTGGIRRPLPTLGDLRCLFPVYRVVGKRETPAAVAIFPLIHAVEIRDLRSSAASAPTLPWASLERSIRRQVRNAAVDG